MCAPFLGGIWLGEPRHEPLDGEPLCRECTGEQLWTGDMHPCPGPGEQPGTAGPGTAGGLCELAHECREGQAPARIEAGAPPAGLLAPLAAVVQYFVCQV